VGLSRRARRLAKQARSASSHVEEGNRRQVVAMLDDVADQILRAAQRHAWLRREMGDALALEDQAPLEARPRMQLIGIGLSYEPRLEEAPLAAREAYERAIEESSGAIEKCVRSATLSAKERYLQHLSAV
jgi:hypothetical protein